MFLVGAPGALSASGEVVVLDGARGITHRLAGTIAGGRMSRAVAAPLSPGSFAIVAAISGVQSGALAFFHVTPGDEHGSTAEEEHEGQLHADRAHECGERDVDGEHECGERAADGEHQEPNPERMQPDRVRRGTPGARLGETILALTRGGVTWIIASAPADGGGAIVAFSERGDVVSTTRWEGTRFGTGLSSPGDLDHDGRPDLLAGFAVDAAGTNIRTLPIFELAH